MKLIQIDYVLAVAKHLNFTNAAKELFISQPTLSTQIKHLEDDLGVTLFIRDKRSVQITPAGKVFFKEFDALHDQINDSLDRIRSFGLLEANSLSIGYPDAINVDSFLPKIIQTFKLKYPNTNLKLNRYRLKDLRTLLMNESLDIIFSFSFDLSSLYACEFAQIERRKPFIIMSSNHPLANKASININELEDEPLICYEQEASNGTHKLTNSGCKLIGFNPKSYIYAKNTDTIISLVSFNQGIAFMDKSICLNTDLVAHDVFPDDCAFDMVAVWLKKNKKESLANFQEIL